MSSAHTYRMPPQPLVDLVDAPQTPDVSISPDHQWLLVMERPGFPPVAELARPELRLAGIRIDPAAHGRSRQPYCTGLVLQAVEGEERREVQGLPDDPRIRGIAWSPDSRRVAFTHTADNGIGLWVLDVAAARAERLPGLRLNEVAGSAHAWLPDSQTLACRTVPDGLGEPPQPPRVPAGPIVQENTGKTAPARTYQDLLHDAHDEALFEHYAAAQVVLAPVGGGVRPIGPADLVTRAEPAPDGQHLLIETWHRPFSYLVPAYRFPRRVEVWDLEGTIVHLAADLSLAEEVPIAFDAVPTGPRAFAWRADAPATLAWAEAQDGGDPANEADIRDQVYTLPAPFDATPQPLIALSLRCGGIVWGCDAAAWVTEHWWQNRRTRSWLVAPGKHTAEPRLLFDRSFEDRYNDPGSPLTEPNPAGRHVLLTRDEGRTLLLRGPGASPEGDQPFLDALDTVTREFRRRWQCQGECYESPVIALDEHRLLTRRESKHDPPNYFLRDLAAGTARQLTRFPHPTPQLRDAHKELVHYTRDDGVELNATLYLPPGYTPEDGPLPLLMWAYPREFKSAAAAGQVSGSPHQFIRVDVRSALPWLALGYAVLDGPTMPIIGEGDAEPNDTYVEQLVASARAAVDYAVQRGVADRGRIAIAGHSYGAFMTANLLAHSRLFRAGIARSGAFNRTLTPFGFQAEERTLWQAPDVYFAMSAFMHAHKLEAPLLLIHGAVDNNSGTFPMQSERFYSALKGHGKTTRLVMLPHESHGYQARESILHTLCEMTEWLDKHVKQPHSPAGTQEDKLA